MQRLAGLVLMGTGLALAALPYLPSHHEAAAPAAPLTQISIAPVRPVERATDEVRSFSPSSPAFRESVSISQRPLPGSLDGTTGQPQSASNTVEPKTGGPWTTVVIADDPAVKSLRSSKAGDYQTLVELTRDIQSELRRVGCYTGEASGYWTPSTRRAMAAFMDRVNASLPFDQPDYILLTLVQAHTGNACSADCPAGQAMAASGRCVPRAVLAQAERSKSKTGRPQQPSYSNDLSYQGDRVAMNRKKDGFKPREAEGRRDVAVSSYQQVAAAAPPVKTHIDPARGTGLSSRDADAISKADAIASALAQERLPWLDGGPVETAAIPRPDPLPGMMSVGGPVMRPEYVAALEPTISIGPADEIQRAPAERPVLRTARIDDATGLDTLDDSSAVSTMEPAPARLENPVDDRPGADDRSSATSYDEDSDLQRQRKAKNKKAVHRPSPTASPRAVESPRPSHYAQNTGRRRRGDPMPGTMQFNVMQSLGGIY